MGKRASRGRGQAEPVRSPTPDLDDGDDDLVQLNLTPSERALQKTSYFSLIRAHTTTVKVGDVVLAKYRSYPLWPGHVCRFVLWMRLIHHR